MDLLEYQAKELLAKEGLPVPAGRLPASAYEAERSAAELGTPVVVKAQVHAGGRGKAGGIKLAATPKEAAALYDELLGKRLVTAQTGSAGAWVRQVYLEKALQIERELYLGFAIDRKEGRAVLIAASEGGMEIERNASHGSHLSRAVVDPALGLTDYALRDIAKSLGLSGAARSGLLDIARRLYAAFVRLDCTLLEINPLALLADGRLAIADCKMSIDDSALFRHAELLRFADIDATAPEEYEASKYGLSYIKLAGSGSVGCMVNGAGLAMATLDAISGRGGRCANFLDLGGGVDADAVKRAFKIILSDERVDTVLVNILGGIVRCDLVAEGIAAAVEEARASLSSGERKLRLVARLAGNHAGEGRELLAKSAASSLCRMEFASNMQEAADLAARSCRAER